MAPRRLFDAAQIELGSLPYQTLNQTIVPQKVTISSAFFNPAVNASASISPAQITSTSSVFNVAISTTASISATPFTSSSVENVTVTTAATIQVGFASSGATLYSPNVLSNYDVSLALINSATQIIPIQLSAAYELMPAFLSAASLVSDVEVQLDGGGQNRSNVLALLGVG